VRWERPVTLALITAADGAAWEAALLAELAGGRVELQVVRRCVDVVELAAVAASGQAAVAVVDARLRRLDSEVVERLTAAEVAVVGVIAAERPAEAELGLLRASGIDFAVPSDATPEVFLQVIRSAVGALRGDERREARHGFADPATATGSVVRPHLAPTSRADAAGDVPPAPGKVVAVWGPTGAPGRTTIAAGVADELSRLDRTTLLVDADLYGGVVANLLGLLDDSPGLVAACRQAQADRLDLAALTSLCWQLGPRLRVLTGSSRADRWPEVRVTAIESVLALSRSLAEYVVVDVGFSLETDEELSFDTMAPRRNGASLAVLDCADLVLAVGSADPIGLQRLVRGLDELRGLELAAPIWVVLNRVRASCIPGKPAPELGAVLERFAGRSAAALIPHDLLAADRAVLSGRSLAEVAPQSPLRTAVVGLASAVAGQPAPAAGRRRRRSVTRQR
jgi:Flp pilus assembly CpaE family ATPase